MDIVLKGIYRTPLVNVNGIGQHKYHIFIPSFVSYIYLIIPRGATVSGLYHWWQIITSKLYVSAGIMLGMPLGVPQKQVTKRWTDVALQHHAQNESKREF